MKESYRADNPVHGVERPAYAKRDRRLNEEEFVALGKALRRAEAAGEPWQAILAIRLLALTGARLGEIVTLLLEDVDLARSALRLSATKTGRSVRPIGDDAAAILKAALARADGATFVFPAARHAEKEMPYGGLPGAWTRIVTPALQGVTAHTLRHSFASVADDLGFSEATVAAMLGHASGSVTRRYIHKVDKALIEAATNVGAEIGRMLNG